MSASALNNNHGSAAGPSVTAALPPQAAGTIPNSSQAPSATVVTPGVAAGRFGNIDLEYMSPARMRPRYGASPAPRPSRSAAASPASELGVELYDDSFTMSPEQLFTRLPTLKRGSKVRGYSAKRLAVSPAGDAARRGPSSLVQVL